MTNFKSKAAIALAAGVMVAGFGLSTPASAGPITDTLYYDWKFQTVATSAPGSTTPGEAATGDIIIGLAYDALLSPNAGKPTTTTTINSKGKPVTQINYNYTYDVVSAFGTVTFSGNGAPVVDHVTGLASTDGQPNNEMFFQNPLPSKNDPFTLSPIGSNPGDGGVGVNLADPVIFGVDISLMGGTQYQLYSINDPSGDTVVTNGIEANLPNTGANNEQVATQSLTQVPEPGAMALIGVGLLGMAWFRRRAQGNPGFAA